GLFARTFCANEFRAQGLVDVFVQCNTSWNVSKGTLRGLHFQLSPSSEVKLTAGNRLALYIPEMFAHGFQTLEEGTEVLYQMSQFYAPKLARGIRYDDSKLGIKWPLPVAA